MNACLFRRKTPGGRTGVELLCLTFLLGAAVWSGCSSAQPHNEGNPEQAVEVTMAEVQPELSPNLQKIEKMYVPQKSKNTEFLEGPPAEMAKKLVEKLKNEVRVL